MKRVLAILTAILVSAAWLAIPVGAITAAFDLWQPAELIGPQLRTVDLPTVDLPNIGQVDLNAYRDRLLADSDPTQIGEAGGGEPEVTVETGTPTSEPPTATPTQTPEPPTPTATTTPTITPPAIAPTTVLTPELDIELAATRVFTTATGTITGTQDITGSVGLTQTTGLTTTVGITDTASLTQTGGLTQTAGLTETTSITATATAIAETVLDPTPAADLASSVVVTVLNVSNVRSGPGVNFDIVGTVDANATVTIIGQNDTGDWYLLDSGAWIFGILLSQRPEMSVIDPDAPPTPTPTLTPIPTLTPAVVATEEPIVEATEVPPIQLTEVITTVLFDSNLRSGPGTTFERVGGIAAGESITISGRYTDGLWYLLDSGNWIFAEVVEGEVNVAEVDENGIAIATGLSVLPATPTPIPAPTAEATPEVVEPSVVNVTEANLRSGPDTTFDIVGTAALGDVLVLVGRDATGEWLRLADGNWIFATLVDNAPGNLPVVEADDGTTAATGTDAAATEAETAEVDAAETDAAETDAAEAVETEASTPTVNADANLRGGPGIEFDIAGGINAGAELALIGQNEAGDWFQLEDENWIFSALVDNAPTDLPVVEVAATDTAATEAAATEAAATEAAATEAAATEETATNEQDDAAQTEGAEAAESTPTPTPEEE